MEAPGPGAPPRRSTAMDTLATTMLIWLAANSDFDVVHHGPPPIRLLSPEALTSLYREQNGVNAGEGAAKIDRRVQGYFSWTHAPNGVIYLVTPQDTPGAAWHADPTDNPLFRERLLHELVHYAQHVGGAYAKFDCPAQGEFDAYRLGGIYLRQLGVPDPMPGRMGWVRRFTAC